MRSIVIETDSELLSASKSINFYYYADNVGLLAYILESKNNASNYIEAMHLCMCEREGGGKLLLDMYNNISYGRREMVIRQH